MENSAHAHVTQCRDAPAGRGNGHSWFPHPYPTASVGHRPTGPWHGVHSALARPHQRTSRHARRARWAPAPRLLPTGKMTDPHARRHTHRMATVPQVKHTERAAGSHALHRQRQRHRWPHGPKRPCPLNRRQICIYQQPKRSSHTHTPSQAPPPPSRAGTTGGARQTAARGCA